MSPVTFVLRYRNRMNTTTAKQEHLTNDNRSSESSWGREEKKEKRNSI